MSDSVFPYSDLLACCLKIYCVVYGFQPFIGGFIPWNLYCQMREPAIRCCAMPVLYANRNIYYTAGTQLLCRFAPFLIVTSSGHADEDLSAAVFRMMNVPVVAALNWTTPSQSPGFTGLNAIQNCIFCTLFDEVLLLSIFPFLQHPILLLPD